MKALRYIVQNPYIGCKPYIESEGFLLTIAVKKGKKDSFKPSPRKPSPRKRREKKPSPRKLNLLLPIDRQEFFLPPSYTCYRGLPYQVQGICALEVLRRQNRHPWLSRLSTSLRSFRTQRVVQLVPLREPELHEHWIPLVAMLVFSTSLATVFQMPMSVNCTTW